MKFTVSKTALLHELGPLTNVADKKDAIPMLSKVLIETTDSTSLRLVSTDLEVSLETRCEGSVSQSGAVALPARKLFDIVRSLPDAEISIDVDGLDWATIKCSTAKFRLAGVSKEHFPSTPQPSGPATLLSSGHLNSLIKRTIFAITLEESRYALSGAQFSLASDTMQMVATDGHRLALALVKLESVFSRNIAVLIPRKTLVELERLTAGSEQPVSFSTDDNHLFFKLDSRLLTSRLLAGAFPDIAQVVPKNNEKSIEVATSALAGTVRRALLMADAQSHGVKFELGANQLTVSATTADSGEARDVLDVAYDGSEQSIGFNGQYVAEFLSVAGDKVSLAIKDEQSPALFRPVVDSNGHLEYKYIVMPMRLQ